MLQQIAAMVSDLLWIGIAFMGILAGWLVYCGIGYALDNRTSTRMKDNR
jgi:hypothetical protein